MAVTIDPATDTTAAPAAASPGGSAPPDHDARIERLSTASLKRVIDPDLDLPGEVGPGAPIPRELLSVVDLQPALTDEQWARLSREELASILDAGIRFEVVLMAGFGLLLARMDDLVDPRATYMLHEVGEETRHSRMFVRVIEQLEPTAKNPLMNPAFSAIDRRATNYLLSHGAFFLLMVLAGEEIPDLIQKRASENPATDPFVREVNRYHRMEEARHLSFARTVFPEEWAKASFVERFIIRRFGPGAMSGTVDFLVHPGVYRTVGLPGWRTWLAARKTPARRELQATAFRPILKVLLGAGVFTRFGRTRVPKAWRQLCQVDPTGTPL